MASKTNGVIARPRIYTYGDKGEYKSAEELERIANTQGEIMLTLGHPAGGLPSESSLLGKVIPTWDSENQVLMGEFWFYDEYFHKLPDPIKQKVMSSTERFDKRVPISAGFALDNVEEGVQKGALYSHIALLVDEDPICPLDTCGINVRLESSDLIRYEQKSEITEPSAKEEPKPREDSGFAELKEQVSQLTELVKSLIPAPQETVAVAETEPVEEPAVVEIEAEQPPVPTPPEPKVEPTTVIPASQPAPTEGEFVDGVMIKGYSIMGGKEQEK